MSAVKENKEVIEKWLNEVNKGNFDVMDEIFTNDFSAHHSIGFVVDRQRYKDAIKNLATNVFPDIHRTLVDTIVTDDRAAVFYTWTGTDTGGYFRNNRRKRTFQ